MFILAWKEEMRQLFFVAGCCAALLWGMGTSASAARKHTELNETIGVLNLLIQQTRFHTIKCAEQVCDLATRDSSVALIVRRSSPRQYRRERLSYVLLATFHGPNFTTRLEMRYYDSQNLIMLIRNNRAFSIRAEGNPLYNTLRTWRDRSLATIKISGAGYLSG